MNRLATCMHVESFVVYIVGNLNGTRCRDGVKVLWYHSDLVGLFFRLPSLHALVFIQKTFCDLFLLLFFFFFFFFCMFCIVVYEW